MTATVRARPLTWALLAAAATFLGTACGVAQPAVNTGIDCSSYGGCDVQEDLANGSSTLIQLRASKFYDANVRARADAQRPGVLDTSVVGHNPPHIALSNLYYRIPTPST